MNKKANKWVEIYVFLFGLFFCTLTFFPFPEYLNGKDSYVMASISQSIINDGKCNYLIHFLSYVGLYPKSYPVAPQMFLAALSLIANLNINASTFIYGFIVFILIYTFSFYLGKLFTGKRLGGLFTGILYVTAPITTQFIGNWNFSNRVLMLTYSPIILFLLAKYIKHRDFRFFSLFILITLLSFTFHRTSYFIMIFLIAFILTMIFSRFISRFRIESFMQKYNTLSNYTLSFFILFLFLSPILFGRYLYRHGGVLVENPAFSIIGGNNPISIFINLGANYALGLGLLTPLLLVGYYFISKDFLRVPLNFFIMMSIILAGFIWVELSYARSFLIILLALIVSIGLVRIKEFLTFNFKKTSISIILVIAVSCCQLIPSLFVINDQTVNYDYQIYNEEDHMTLLTLSNKNPQETIDMSNYIRVYRNDSELFSNYYHPETQIRAFSGMGPSGNWVHIKDYERYSPNWNQSNILNIILGNKVELGQVEGPEYSKIDYSVFYNEPGTSEEFYEKSLQYNVGGPGDYYVIIVLVSSDRLVWNDDPSIFLISLQNENYKTYENTLLSLTYFSP